MYFSFISKEDILKITSFHYNAANQQHINQTEETGTAPLYREYIFWFIWINAPSKSTTVQNKE